MARVRKGLVSRGLRETKYWPGDVKEFVSRTRERIAVMKKVRALDRANKFKGDERRAVRIRPWFVRWGENKHGYRRVKLETTGQDLVVRVPAGKRGTGEFKVVPHFRVEGELFRHVFIMKQRIDSFL